MLRRWGIKPRKVGLRVSIEWFSIKGRKYQHNYFDQSWQGKQRNEPIQICRNSMELAQSAGKIARASRDWFWFCFSLVDKLARDF